MTDESRRNAYADAGVNIEAADTAIELMKVWIDKARRPEMIGGLGGFAGLFDASALTSYTRPLLATSTDGVGTKVAIAQAMDVHDTIGFDLVGMVVDDLVVCGAEPLFMTDYIATGRVVPERIAAIVKGIAEACVDRRLRADRRRDRRAPRAARPRRVRRRRRDHRRRRGRPAARPRPGPPGRRRDRDGGLAACTPTATPWSATCCSQKARAGRSTAHVHELGRTLGEELLEPTRIYAKACLDLADRTGTARDVPRHRRRPGGQPRAGAAGRAGRHHRPRHLDPAAGLRPGPPRRRRAPARPRDDPELRRRHGRADRSRRRRRGDRGARRARRPGLGGRRGRAPTPSAAAAGSSWWASTPAGDVRRFASRIAGSDVREQPGIR